MSSQDWPDNWPPLDTLRVILRSHPNGCRRSNFEHLDAKRPAGIIAIAGPGWINIRKRLLDLGVASLLPDGSLVLADQSAANQAPAQGGYSADQITAALAEVFADNDAGDSADFAAQVLAKLGEPQIPDSLASIAEPDPDPMPPPLSSAELSARWQPLFEHLLGLLPTSEAEAIGPKELRARLEASDWKMVAEDLQMIEAMFGPNARDQRDEIVKCGGSASRPGHALKAWRQQARRPISP
jgi:hypothetical protein